MPRYAAFLRAINVGGNHPVPMKELRALLEKALKLTGVQTFIASDNVLFDAPAGSAKSLEQRWERALQKKFGFEVRTFIRSAAELKEIARSAPFGKEQGASDNTLYVAFCEKAPPPAAGARVLALANKVDALHLAGEEVYWLRRRALGESALSGAILEKALGMAATVRNLNTLNKMVAALD